MVLLVFAYHKIYKPIKEEKKRKAVPDGVDPPIDDVVKAGFEDLEDMIATNQDEDIGKDDYTDGGDG